MVDSVLYGHVCNAYLPDNEIASIASLAGPEPSAARVEEVHALQFTGGLGLYQSCH